MEKRYRALVTFWHDLYQCHVEPGEDYRMDGIRPDKTPWRGPDDIQKYLDTKQMELYFSPVGTPHVVHIARKYETCNQETGEWSVVTEYNPAAKQWAGETVFIEEFTPSEVTATKE